MLRQGESIVEAILRSYGAFLPYHRGKGRIIDKCVALFPFLGKGKRECLRQDLLWKLDLECIIQRSIYYTGWYEIWDTQAVRRFVKPGCSVLDVGANIGYYSLLFGKWVGSMGVVHSFEPSREVFDQLSRHVSINNLHWVKPHLLALGDRSSTVRMSPLISCNRGVQHILLEEKGDLKAEERVNIRTLDSFVDEIQLKRCDFIKIDIEGFEMSFLLGASRTIQTFKPVILVELNTDALKVYSSNPQEVLSFLDNLGYKLYRTNGREMQLLTDFPSQGEYFNVFALPSGL